MFRQMRRHNQQLEHEACERILEHAPRGVLAVLGDDGYPYTVPMDFVYDQGRIYFHSAVEGHKLDAIQACDKCSFCVLDEGVREEDDWWYHFNSVIVFGRIRRMTDKGDMVAALRKIGAKYFPSDYDTEGDIARSFAHVAVLELTIEHMTGKHVREK
ncbi:MAG: pyridoxamine 5'-phosphate oxidase family protein [Atopobiaceae bacterium]|nr:pyridoxamine 5'-phosphate oxidase family protein [Atopobiaceae bacterium]